MKKPQGYFSFTIQTKPYLKKYLHSLYGSPLTFSLDNQFGICIAAFLYRTNLSPTKKALRLRTDKYDDLIEVHIPLTFLTENKTPFNITEEHTICINKLFERKFEEELWLLTMVRNIGGMETRDALEEFTKMHNIEIDEDITMDALVKKEYRHRTKVIKSSPYIKLLTLQKTLTNKSSIDVSCQMLRNVKKARA